MLFQRLHQTILCMWVYVLHYHNLCMSVWLESVQNSWWICQRLQSSRRLSPWWTSCSDVYRDLLFNSGASQKTSRDAGINRIKRRKQKESGINIANRNSFWLRWGPWQWKRRVLSPPSLFICSDTHTLHCVCMCVYVYQSICSVFYFISTWCRCV